jgi:outer membrane protein assembly factor BamB
VKLFAAALGVALIPAPAVSADWPQWRGPHRDGVVRGANVVAKWPSALREQWKVEVGEGVSSPVVVGADVYVFTRRSDDEFLLCLDLASGAERWRSRACPAPYEWWPGEGTFSKGPRSPPTVAADRVYTAGVSGIVSCLDSRTGRLRWRKHSTSAPPYGGPASPLVTDDMCIVHLGCGGIDDGLTAFDAASGDVKWRLADGSRPGAGSPIVFELAGERQVVALTSWEILGVAVDSGRKLWSVRLDGSEKNSTPILFDDLIIFADYKERPRAIRLEKSPASIVPKQVWQGDGPAPYMSSPVVDGDFLYGMSARRRGSFFGLDARNGKTLWEKGDDDDVFGYASVVRAGGAVIFLTEKGRLIVVKPSGKQFEVLAQYQVSDRQTWAYPVFLGDRILVRDDTTLRSLGIAPDDGA